MRLIRRALLGTALAFLIPATGLPHQFPPAKFFENPQPTRLGPDAAMFPDTPQRLKIDLAGQWRYTIDGTNWGNVGVPGAYDFTGRVTFQRTFEIKPEMLDKYAFTLVVYGINYQSEIQINGNFVGRHLGGCSSFVLPVPANDIQVGSENAIRIAVDNELTPKTTLPLRQQVGGWRTYGGIYRDIYLLAVPKLAIDDEASRVDLVNDQHGEVKSAKVTVRAEIADRGSLAPPPAGQPPSPGGLLGFQVEIDDKLSGEMVGRSGITPIVPQANKTVSVQSEVILQSPKLWAPESPDLYLLKCQIVRVVNKEPTVLDEFRRDLGVRDVRWKDGRLFVSGSPVLLRGLVWHEDHPSFGSALSYEALEHDVAAMKAVGTNLVRFLAPPHPYLLNLCDRYGIFVMEEIPVDGVPSEILAKDYFGELASTYAREMIERDRHHVSVLAWGMGDDFETAGPNACDFTANLRSVMKSLDDRPLYFASRFLKDACIASGDIVALNAADLGQKELRDALKECRAQAGDKPVILARYGRDIEPGNHNGYSDPLSLESQARCAMQGFEAAKDARVAGSVLWAFNDWRTDRAALTAHSPDPYLRAMGIVAYDREKRTAYDVVRALFNGEKVQALPVGNYSSNAPIIFVIAGFVALISFAFMYNGNRRFRDCVNRSLLRTYNFFADVRDQRILTYLHSFSLAAIVSVTIATILASAFTHYRESLFLDNLLSQVLSDNMKEWLIRLIWHPLKFICIIAALNLALLFFLAVAVRVLSVMVRTRVYFYHAFSVTMWSTLPAITLIPVAMIMFRLMETPVYLMPLTVGIGVITLWVLIRFLKGISIIYDVYPIKVYAVGLLVIVLAGAALYGYLDYTKSTTVYLKYMMQSIKNSA